MLAWGETNSCVVMLESYARMLFRRRRGQGLGGSDGMVAVGGKIGLYRMRQEKDAEASLKASFQNEGRFCK